MIAQVIMKPNRGLYEPQVALLIQELGKEETRRDVCPVCKGGTSGEKSFVYSRDDRGVGHYICFRATCSIRGTIYSTPEHGSVERVKRRKYEMNRDLVTLSSDQTYFFREKFDINPGSDILYAPQTGMFMHRICGPMGQHRGWQGRDYLKLSSIRALGYPNTDDPWQAWYSPSHAEEQIPVPNGTLAIVVEDCLSARKVSDSGFDSVALLGTNLNYDKVYEIADCCRNVILALDRGTLPLMIKHRQLYGSLFDTIKIWSLDQDLKYVSRKRIREGVFDDRTDFITEP